MYDWCEERLEIQSLADDILAKFVPPHVNIFYCFGGIMLTSFPSVQLILYHVNLGWFIKSIHRWSSSIMVLILVIIHFSMLRKQGISGPL